MYNVLNLDFYTSCIMNIFQHWYKLLYLTSN